MRPIHLTSIHPGLPVMAGCGIALFLVTVLVLQQIQTDYDPQTQLMSELALGRHGSFMLLAFGGLALAHGALALAFYRRQASWLLILLLGASALLFLGAGGITLADSAVMHVLLVAVAFVLCGLGMYLLPRLEALFASLCYRWLSWSAGGVMALATALSGQLLAAGSAQRIAAGALLAWLALLTWRLFTAPQNDLAENR